MQQTPKLSENKTPLEKLLERIERSTPLDESAQIERLRIISLIKREYLNYERKYLKQLKQNTNEKSI